MTNITVKNYTVVNMCMEIIMCQYEMSPEMFMIPQTYRIEGTSKNALHRRSHMEESLPAFRVTFAKPFLLKIQYSKPFKIIEIWTLHISVFVNMTNIKVKSYAVQYMCMEVIICQSERSPEIVMISQTHTMGGHQNTSDESRNIEETFPVFGVTSAEPFPPKIGQLKNSKIVKFWTFHMYLFAFTEVIVCKPDMSPET